MPIDGKVVIKQYDALKSARSARDSIISVLAPYTDPSRGSTSSELPSDGQPWMTEVFDSTGNFAHDLSGRYIQGQSTNPGKKWFRMRDDNDAIAEEDEVKEWCEESADRMLKRIDKSNFYESDFQIRKDWYGFGCGAGLAEERQFLRYKDQKPGYRGLNLTFDMIGRFVAGWDTWGDVYQFGVERMWRADAAVERFGEDNVSDKIQEAFRANKVDEQFKFIHFISPRGSGEYGDKGKEKTKFKTCWVEYATGHVNEEGGINRINALVPRQNGLFGEPYGRGRGDIALNDLISLSTGKRLSFEDWALKIRPVTMVRSQVLFGQQNVIPGSFLTANWNSQRPLSDAFFQYDGGGRPEVAQIKEEELRKSIDNAYMIKHLQQVLALEGQHQQTAYERAQIERHVLRLIASIHASYQFQFLQPFIDILFEQMYLAGEFSDVPDIMLQQGGKLTVVFDSPLATTQTIDEVQAMEEFELKILNHAAQYQQATGQASPVLDLVNWEEWYRVLGNKIKVPSKPIRSLQEVALIQDSKAEEERKQLINQELAGGAEALGKVSPFLKVMQGGKESKAA